MESSVAGGRRGYQPKQQKHQPVHQYYHSQQPQPQPHSQFKQQQQQQQTLPHPNHHHHYHHHRQRQQEDSDEDSNSDDDGLIRNRYNTSSGAGHRYHTVGSPTSISSPIPHFPPPPSYPPPHRDFYADPVAVARTGSSTVNHKSVKTLSHRYPAERYDTECEPQTQLSSSRSFNEKAGGAGGRNPVVDRNGLVTTRPKHKQHSKAEPQNKWLQNNIAATMEHFRPAVASTSKDTSGRGERLQDDSRKSFDYHQAVAGPSTMPTPNSIRALLMTANRNRTQTPSPRHMYTTRYGTQENIYEEITDEERMHLISGHSMLSLNQNTLEEEFRQVQNRHRRILGELNLSVEALLMPTTPPSDSPTGEDDEAAASGATCIDELLTGAVGPTDELLSPVSAHATLVGDLDSGFSGSSGASYVGSLRYRTGLMTRSSTPSGPSSGSMSGSGSCRSSQRSNEDPGILSLSSRSSSLYGSTKVKAAEDPGPAGSKDTKNKSSFWSRKGWRKFPGFSSTSSVHKTGLNNNGESNSIFSFDA